MGNFRKPHGNGGDRGGFGKPGFSRPSFGGRPERGGFDKEMFDAVCSHCGKACKVPFRPNGKKPVFCSACFNSPRGDSPISRDRAPVPQPYHGNTIPSISGQARELANVPQAEDRRIDDMKRKLDSMDSKLDTILRAMTTKAGEQKARPSEERGSTEASKPNIEPKKKAIARKK